MNTYRESIHEISESYPNWKCILESDYELLGASDDELISPIKYYFNPRGFSAVLSNNILIISGNTKTRVKKEIMRIKKKLFKFYLTG
jgi:hypothetical protein